MTDLIRPMLATPGPVPTGTGWAFEFKWDGVRAVSYARGSTVQVFTRNDKDVSTTYPELGAVAELLAGSSLVVDGEIVALHQGRPNFGNLQNRMHVTDPDDDLLTSTPVRYYLFDVLELDGKDTTRLPYRQRRELLTDLFGLLDEPEHPVLVLPPSFTDLTGAQLLDTARQHRLEGIVAKLVDSRYEPGRRSRSWIKTPLVDTQEVLIGGWRAGAGRRAGTIGSLLLGAPGPTGVRYLGHVGTGFTDAMLRDLSARLAPLARPDSPFDAPIPKEHARDAHWVQPRLVGEVEFRQLTNDGLLRHSSWRGLRPDRDPDDISLPTLP
ncbi:MAG TPA: non-homologous end-joining DNA ligase [Pseudonocardiaceae bacterium]